MIRISYSAPTLTLTCETSRSRGQPALRSRSGVATSRIGGGASIENDATTSDGLFKVAGAGGHVNGMLLERGERDDLQCQFVG